ncbi:MAG TPA: thioredoxin [Chitinophagaceae bacterium]|nr:thioredoxin [Chitinophagaceae bacterium]
MTFQEMINSDTPVLVDFSAEWCGPCKMMAPILKQTKDSLGDKVRIIKVDIDRNPEAAQFYQVQGVPTLILFRKGQVLWRQSGVLPASTLVQVVNQHN